MLALAGGVGLAEADALREALVAQGDDRVELAALRERFLAAARHGGRDRDLAEKTWDVSQRFAAYSFSRAHAASHARLSLAAAHLREHFPAAFAAALVEHHAGSYPLRSIVASLRREGLRFLPPSVQRSVRATTLERMPDEELAVRLGLARIRGLPRAAAKALLAAREQGGAFSDVPARGPRHIPLPHLGPRGLAAAGPYLLEGQVSVEDGSPVLSIATASPSRGERTVQRVNRAQGLFSGLAGLVGVGKLLPGGPAGFGGLRPGGALVPGLPAGWRCGGSSFLGSAMMQGRARPVPARSAGVGGCSGGGVRRSTSTSIGQRR